jgi:hypothetical protein
VDLAGLSIRVVSAKEKATGSSQLAAVVDALRSHGAIVAPVMASAPTRRRPVLASALGSSKVLATRVTARRQLRAPHNPAHTPHLPHADVTIALGLRASRFTQGGSAAACIPLGLILDASHEPKRDGRGSDWWSRPSKRDRLMLHRADLLGVVGARDSDRVISMGVDETRVFTLPAIQTQWQARDASRTRLQWDINAFVIGTDAHTATTRDVQILSRAAALAVARDLGITFVIFGGALDLRRLRQSVGAGTAVIFHEVHATGHGSTEDAVDALLVRQMHSGKRPAIHTADEHMSDAVLVVARPAARSAPFIPLHWPVLSTEEAALLLVTTAATMRAAQQQVNVLHDAYAHTDRRPLLADAIRARYARFALRLLHEGICSARAQ